MGNASTREAGQPYGNHTRNGSASSRYRSGSTAANDGRSSNPNLSTSNGAASSSRQRDRDRDAERTRNLEHALLGLGMMSTSGIRDRERSGGLSSSRSREEEREAREAKRLEKEKEKERERQWSLQNESCDGGFLVTQGVYTGPQDFKDKIVRHLMLERKLAPFWKGLSDHEDNWTDAQLVAAVKGLQMPGPEVQCEPEESLTLAGKSSTANASDLNLHLTVPIGSRSRSHSYTSDSGSASGSAPIPSPLLSCRTRSKTLTISSPRNPVAAASATNPLETDIPGRYVDGRPIEAVLYKEAKECPICFLYYPPWMNRTRCCDYDICSECFVQIKRAEPHLPEHEIPGADSHGSQVTNPDLLISEPACCPFCKEPNFGVVYYPPPFRRGLVYTDSLAPSYSSPGMSSSSYATPESSLPHSPISPGSPPPGGTRRKTALASTAPEVVTTDQIRPDWAQKLQNARTSAARRAAAATALHTAAFLMGGLGGGSSSSGGSREGGLTGTFSSRRLIRRTGLGGSGSGGGSDSPSSGGSGAGTPRGQGASETLGPAGLGLLGLPPGGGGRIGGTGPGNTGEPPSRRRSRIVDLEEMMLREAIRLSILEEEERKKREEKEKEKEEREAKEKAEEERKKGVMREPMDEGGSSSGSAEGKGKTVDRSGVSGVSGVDEGESSGSSAGKDEGASSAEAPITTTGVSPPSPELQSSSSTTTATSADAKAVEAGIVVAEDERDAPTTGVA